MRLIYRPVVTIVSGGFDPVHEGHLAMLDECRKNGDICCVLLNSDKWLARKKGKPFQNLITRSHVIDHIVRNYGIVVVGFDDSDDTVCDGILKLRVAFPAKTHDMVFCNGGDRGPDNTPESFMCQRLGIEMRFNVGGLKINSSSKLLSDWSGVDR